MMKALFSRKKNTRPFKEYHAEWLETLKNTLLPLLSHSLSSFSSSAADDLLSSNVSLLHNHFQSYYSALDLAAADDVSQVLHPDWRNPLEMPFLFLGDFHPKIFTSLLRSFLVRDEASCSGDFPAISQNFGVLENRDAWRNPSETLTSQIEQIECGLRLMVPSLAGRARDAQAGLVGKVAAGWWASQCERRRRKEEEGEVGKMVMEAVDELSCVVVDANRLRRSVLCEILAAIDVYQAALFLQALAQFVVGFKDADLLSEFKRAVIPSIVYRLYSANRIESKVAKTETERVRKS
ncbi:hypothetical protein V2J09_008035 [Rumex salicifolius]